MKEGTVSVEAVVAVAEVEAVQVAGKEAVKEGTVAVEVAMAEEEEEVVVVEAARGW